MKIRRRITSTNDKYQAKFIERLQKILMNYVSIRLTLTKN
jgi:hypothetical protein